MFNEMWYSVYKSVGDHPNDAEFVHSAWGSQVNALNDCQKVHEETGSYVYARRCIDAGYHKMTGLDLVPTENLIASTGGWDD